MKLIICKNFPKGRQQIMKLNDKRIYVTTQGREELRKKFLNFRFYYFISIPEIIEKLDEDINFLSDRSIFLINNIITEGILDCLKRKKHLSIIYSNPDMDYTSIKNLMEKYENHPNITNISLLDSKNSPENEDYWQFFNEITFFPEITKKKIMECKTINFLENNTSMYEKL